MSLPTAPKISVAMSVRNGAPFLQAAIDSILRQTFTDFEFLIVNDGSTDETPAILNRQTDGRIRVFHRPPSGLPASLNFAIAESKADLIARQDADDTSEPSRLEQLYFLLNSTPEATMANCANHYDFEPGITIPKRYMPRSRALSALFFCMGRATYGHGSALFRKDAFYQIGKYNETYAQAQDYDLWSRMIEVGCFIYCSQKLYRYRRYAQAASVQKAEAQAKFTAEIAKNNCRRFFQVDEAEAARIFEFLKRFKEQPVSAWWRFIRRDLPRLRYQSAELYLWAMAQTLRSLKGNK